MNRTGKQKGGFTMVAMEGKIFGKLTVLTKDGKSNNGIYYYQCMCECGNQVKVSGQKLRNGNTKACLRCSVLRGPDSPFWKGVGKISMSWWGDHVIRKNRSRNDKSRGRGIKSIEIDINYGWKLFIKQKGECALTGISLTFPEINQNINSGTASLDRIDNNKDYVVGNVQWVHKEINILKSNFKQDRFIELCGLVTKHHQPTQ